MRFLRNNNAAQVALLCSLMVVLLVPAGFCQETTAGIEGQVRDQSGAVVIGATLEIASPVTQRTILDALESRYPALCGTIRDHVTHKRRAFLRFFACEQDLSLESPDAPLPDAVVSGDEPYLIIGGLAGG